MVVMRWTCELQEDTNSDLLQEGLLSAQQQKLRGHLPCECDHMQLCTQLVMEGCGTWGEGCVCIWGGGGGGVSGEPVSCRKTPTAISCRKAFFPPRISS